MPLVLLHVIAIIPRPLEAGGQYLLFSEADDWFGLLGVGAVAGPSGVLGVFSIVLFAKLGGATGPHLSLMHGVPLASCSVTPHRSSRHTHHFGPKKLDSVACSPLKFLNANAESADVGGDRRLALRLPGRVVAERL